MQNLLRTGQFHALFGTSSAWLGSVVRSNPLKKGTKMRIAMLTWESLHSIAVGGVAAHVSELADALADMGHEVHVFTRAGENQPEYEQIGCVHEHRCRYDYRDNFVDDVNSMCGAIAEQVIATEDHIGAFDIIHAHDWLAANAMIWLKQQRGRRSILTIHSTEYGRCGNAFPDGQSAWVREQERAGLYWCDHAIAVSGVTQAEITGMYEVPMWKTSVVHNGVRNTRFDVIIDAAHEKARYDIDAMDPTALFCGRMAYQKGPDLLLEAIPSVLKYYDRAKFIFAGDGDMRWSLEERAREMGIDHAVRFLGHRNGEELPRLFKLADIVCVPSRNEPFGIVVLEAWSAGKPVVVTQIGGPQEYVDHEVTGLKIYPNADSVAWGLGTMFLDFDRARCMGEAGLATVQQRFTWDRIAEKTLAVYDPSHQPSVRETIVTTDMTTRVNGRIDRKRTASPQSPRHEVVSTSSANGSHSSTTRTPRTPRRNAEHSNLDPGDDLLGVLRRCRMMLREVEETLPPSPNGHVHRKPARQTDRHTNGSHGKSHADRNRARHEDASDAKERRHERSVL
jgi:glycogen synthase